MSNLNVMTTSKRTFAHLNTHKLTYLRRTKLLYTLEFISNKIYLI